MQKHKFQKTEFIQKKGRSFLLLPFFLPVFLLTFSCAYIDPTKYGRVTPQNTADNNTFIYSVSDEFAKQTVSSPADEKNPKISVAEAKLLERLLDLKKYCLDKSGNPQFTITSRQEKIFDMTFANLIEKNYNARPIAPRMYFGQCEAR